MNSFNPTSVYAHVPFGTGESTKDRSVPKRNATSTPGEPGGPRSTCNHRRWEVSPVMLKFRVTCEPATVAVSASCAVGGGAETIVTGAEGRLTSPDGRVATATICVVPTGSGTCTVK